MKKLLISAVLVLTIAASLTAKSPVDAVNKSGDGVAVKGYDVVAYFQQSKPVKGTARFTHEWMGAKWQFANAADRDLFAADPQKYAPQFGGYCSWAVGHGYTADIDPEAWKIIEGKLYLNYNKDVQKKWLEDTDRWIGDANKTWPGLHR